MLCKFSNNPKYLEDLQNGFMYMNSSEYFNNLPKGVGDELDGKLVVNNFDISIKDKNSNNNIIQLSNNGNNHSYLEISFNKYFPIFCMARFKKTDLIEIKKDIFQFKPESIDVLEKTFGEYMLCFTIDDKRVINIFENCINNNKYEAICGPIKYYDFSKKDDAWIEDAMKEDRMGIYLIKDIYFQEQKEFRFVICEDDLITKNKPYYRLNLQHSFKNESEIIKVTDLKNKYFKLIT